MDKKWWTLVAVCTGTFMLLLDVTIVIVAQPAIQSGLHASFSDVQWVLDAYALTLASLLLTSGALADRYGRKRLFGMGLIIFTVGSLLCGLAQDPLMLIELARICDEVGFPPGVVNIVTSSKAEPAAVLTESPDVDCVSFTGSTAVGARIYESGARTMKRMLLELGGKGAALVLADGDVAKAVTALVSVWGFHSGQICTAPTRAIVHRSLYDEVVSKLAATAPMLTVGPPTDPKTVIGPVISGAHRERVENYVRSGPAEGADLVVGGERPPFDKGFYVAPTLLANCTNQMTAAREEIFGPVIVAIPFDDEEEGIAIANDSVYGLYDYVFGEDTARAYEVAKRLQAGHVGINTAQRNFEAPFGGWKMSGVGRDGGDFGLHAYTELQSVIWPG